MADVLSTWLEELACLLFSHIFYTGFHVSSKAKFISQMNRGTKAGEKGRAIRVPSWAHSKRPVRPQAWQLPSRSASPSCPKDPGKSIQSTEAALSRQALLPTSPPLPPPNWFTFMTGTWYRLIYRNAKKSTHLKFSLSWDPWKSIKRR